MKIIEAVWEQRNLGVTCAECSVELDDTSEDVFSSLQSRTEQYLVVKVPSERSDLLISLQNEGFKYIETLFAVNKDLKHGVEAPSFCAGMIKHLSYREAEADEVAALLQNIRQGEIFSTDRIAIDPFFSRELAGNRYANWISDLLSSGESHLLFSVYKGEPVGFFVTRQKGNICDSVLGGVFPQYLGSGFGILNQYCEFLWTAEHGMRSSVSHVSSNNMPIFRICLLFGCKIESVCNVFIKHQL